MKQEDINARFRFYERSRTNNALAHERVREACQALAETLNSVVPDGREQSLAITHLEDVMMWSNAGIARAS